jgi:superfamily II DNA/RNA helicase
MSFSALGLSPPLMRAVAALGFVEPTAVQRATFAPVLAGRDVWASAETGSGKTAAFVLPLLQGFGQATESGPAAATRAGAPSAGAAGTAPLQRRRERALRAVVLAPTRELALQTAAVFDDLGAHLAHPPRVVAAVGGVSIEPQRMALRGGADFVVATPGRLLELVRSGSLDVGRLKTLVLDEADRLLSAGFADELVEVLAQMPPVHQSVLVSATMPTAVRDLARAFLVNPVAINIDHGALPADAVITQRAIEVDKMYRTPLLRALLAQQEGARALVFVASRRAAEHVAAKLQKTGEQATALHGELTQAARSEALDALRGGQVRVVVATDLAARGVDIEGLDLVVQYDLPRGAVDYLHRVGRTGRAGAQGTAISFITAEGSAHFDVLMKKHGLDIKREQVPGFEPRDAPVSPHDPHGGVKGRRKSKKDKLREAAAAARVTPASAPAADADADAVDQDD